MEKWVYSPSSVGRKVKVSTELGGVRGSLSLNSDDYVICLDVVGEPAWGGLTVSPPNEN